MSYEVPVQFDLEHRRFILGDEPMVFHCHHYSLYLQRTINDDAGGWFDAPPVLIGAGAEGAYAQMAKLFARDMNVAARKRCAEEIYRWAGFGTVDLTPFDENGGVMRTANSHYAMGWKAKWGHHEDPVCFFTAGWLAGALAAIYDKPLGAYKVTHDMCSVMKGCDVCEFKVELGAPNYKVFESVGVGRLTEHKPRPVTGTGVDYDGIMQAVAGLPLVGNEEGTISAFGVYLTRHYANYYCRISYELIREATKLFGEEGRSAAEELLVEAGHQCAFNTYGGIMISTEWDALIKPMLKNQADWVHGVMAVSNCMGWGRWQVTSASEARAEFVFHDDYESVGYEAMYGKAAFPVTHLARGALEGLMDLVYIAEIDKKPALTKEFYSDVFRKHAGYRTHINACRAMGDSESVFEVLKV